MFLFMCVLCVRMCVVCIPYVYVDVRSMYRWLTFYVVKFHV